MLLTIYIYSTETDALVGEHSAATNAECEVWADAEFGSNDYYWVYTKSDVGQFVDGADSRETSVELMEAIRYVAGSNEAAVRVWENPSEPEMLAIWERVTKNGLVPSADFCWGAAGSQWAEDITES